MNNPSEFGHPTLGPFGGPSGGGGGGGGASGISPRQALAAQTAWFIDPINGRNTNNGQTLGTAIQTRSEFFRRMSNVTITQNVTVTITSSLLPNDTFVSIIYVQTPFSLAWVGIPIAALTFVAAGYVARNGATNVVSKINLGVPVAPFVGRIIEWTNGGGLFVRGTIVADLGGNVAWISPQVDQAGTPAVFVNGTTINVWTLPSLGAIQIDTVVGTQSYLYFSATNWRQDFARTDYISCTGAVLQFGGQSSTINCVFNNYLINGGGGQITSGQMVPFAAADGSIRIVATPTCSAMRAESGGIISYERSATFAPDAEVSNTGSGNSEPFAVTGGGRIIMDTGNIYGTSNQVNGDLARFTDRNGLIVFQATPTVLGATTIFFSLAARRELVTRLALISLSDYVFSNRCLGPVGEFINAETMMRQFLGVSAETFSRNLIVASTAIASGMLCGTSVVLRVGQIVTNISLGIRTAAVLPTLTRVGLYDKAGNLLASSVDQGVNWTVVGMKTIAVTVPFTVLTTDLYYLAFIFVGTTGPGIWTTGIPSAQLQAMGVSIGAGLLPYFATAALADLPNPATIANPAGSTPGFFWLAIS